MLILTALSAALPALSPARGHGSTRAPHSAANNVTNNVTNNEFEAFFLSRKRSDRRVHKEKHYFDVYERTFAPLRQSARDAGRPLRMLELGVQSGGSLDMWKHYFGESLDLHGVDINPLCKRFEDRHRNITIHLGATSDGSFMADLAQRLAPIDIVLDDASHHSPDIIAAFDDQHKTYS